MSLFEKPIEQISVEDVQQLIDNEVQESRILDYKEELYLDTGDQKREFSYDITALANSGGGEMIFGVSELREGGQPTGRPESIVGINVNNADALIRQTEDLIRTSVEPRIYGIQMGTVTLDLDQNRCILIIRVPYSLNSPHMVSIGGTQRFYLRNSAGKHPMDISEIRSSILSSTSIMDKVRDLRFERISKIKVNDGFTQLKSNDHVLAIDLVPYSSLSSEVLDVSVFREHRDNLRPFFSVGMRNRYNFDGYITYGNLQGDVLPHTYVQLTKKGMIEAVESERILQADEGIPSEYIEEEIINRVEKYMNVLNNLGVRPPIVLIINLLGVKGTTLSTNVPMHIFQNSEIEQNDLLLPEIVFESYADSFQEYAKIIKPAFDSMWNAAGFPHSGNYNEQGEWIGPRR